MKSLDLRFSARTLLILATCFLNALVGQTGIEVSSEARPWISLRPLLTQPQRLIGEEVLFREFRGKGRPTALASADFDGDGVPDLACGYSIGETGLISLHRGNKDPVYPDSVRSMERRRKGIFLQDPFFPEAGVLSVPEVPDFLGAGDFDGDRHWDLVAVSKGGSILWHLAGRGDGSFGEQPAGFETSGS